MRRWLVAGLFMAPAALFGSVVPVSAAGMSLTLSADGGSLTAPLTASAVVPLNCSQTMPGMKYQFVYYWDVSLLSNVVATTTTTCDTSRNEITSEATFTPMSRTTNGLHTIQVIAYDETHYIVASGAVAYAVGVELHSPAPSSPPATRPGQPAASPTPAPPPPADLPAPSLSPSALPINCATLSAAVLPRGAAGGLFLLAFVGLIVVVPRGRRLAVLGGLALIFATVSCAATQDLVARSHGSPRAAAESTSPTPCPSSPAAGTN